MISLVALDSAMASVRKLDNVQSAICLIRDQRVMLDSDLAAIYQVTTKELNQQSKRNKDRFPEDFAFQLMAEEFKNLKSQSAASTSRSQFVTSKRRGGRRYLPWAFRSDSAAGWKPAGPTAETAMPLFSNPQFAIRNPRL
jgi:ORF6N domain-containing protein